MRKRVLKVKDVEQLENTSVVSALLAAAGAAVPDPELGPVDACDLVSCVGVSCVGQYATFCNTQGATVAVTGADLCVPPQPTDVACGVTAAWYCQTGSQCVCAGGQTLASLQGCPSNFCCTTQV